ncbi:hypothetical protein BXA15_06380 [Campylobacter lari]|uniref:hypothetical protein n=1 Tax=Campylobacter lari TaxID=201 RepID=UPI0017F52C67|nr:hypothetical protein [Campylobacter lari]EAI3897251.1 hypothetical protein [Campylobacter lari]EAJ5697092.1 hypothetical protein [Campylobacter lari]EHC7929214.1 hypothetical protein [Campylobacter lari]MCR2079423.1 hypothetical protein [Campylobacter lari subsp. concheus]
MLDSCYLDLEKREREADTLAKELMYDESMSGKNLFYLKDLIEDFITDLESKMQDWEFSTSLETYREEDINFKIWDLISKVKETQKTLNAIKA